MTKREFIDRNGNSWEWEETPQTVEAIKNLYKSSIESKLKRPNTKLED
jgi:hypothetical protein